MPSARLRWIVDRHLRAILTRIESPLQEAIEVGRVRSVDAETTILMIVGAATGYLASAGLSETLFGHEPMTEANARTYADRVAEFCWHGLAG